MQRMQCHQTTWIQTRLLTHIVQSTEMEMEEVGREIEEMAQTSSLLLAKVDKISVAATPAYHLASPYSIPSRSLKTPIRQASLSNLVLAPVFWIKKIRSGPWKILRMTRLKKLACVNGIIDLGTIMKTSRRCSLAKTFSFDGTKRPGKCRIWCQIRRNRWGSPVPIWPYFSDHQERLSQL